MRYSLSNFFKKQCVFKDIFEEKTKISCVLTIQKYGFWKKSLQGTDWFWFWTYMRQSIYVVRTIIHNQKWCVLMCAMQCTTLIETCSQCTNSSIFNLNLPSKLAGMQVLQNGRRFGSTRDPQNFQKFCFVFYNISKPFCNVSHLFLNLFSVNRLVNGEKVSFQPIVPWQSWFHSSIAWYLERSHFKEFFVFHLSGASSKTKI